MSDPHPLRLRTDELAAHLLAGREPTLDEQVAELIENFDPDRAHEHALSLLAERRWAEQIPSRFTRATLADVNDELRGKLSRWSNAVIAGGAGPLVLTGPVGTGKTYAACAGVRPLVERGLTLAFWPVVRLLDALRPSSDADPYPAAVAADLLLLDDLGAERATDWTAERLYALVNDRWLSERPTIVTTNLTPPQLTQAVGERLSSRLLGGATIALLSGPDRRMS